MKFVKPASGEIGVVGDENWFLMLFVFIERRDEHRFIGFPSSSKWCQIWPTIDH